MSSTIYMMIAITYKSIIRELKCNLISIQHKHYFYVIELQKVLILKLKQKTPVFKFTLPIASYVILNKLINFSEPKYSYKQYDKNISWDFYEIE